MRPPSQRAAHRNYSACLQVMFGLGTPTPSKAMFALSTLERSNVDTSLIQTLAAESNCDVGVPMSFVLLSEDTGARTIVSSRCGLKEVQLHIVLLLACCSSFSCMKGQGESVMRFVLTNSSESILQVKTIKNIQKLFWMACFWVHNAPTLGFLQRPWLATNLQATAPPPLTTLLTTHHNHHASQPASNNSHRNDRCCFACVCMIRGNGPCSLSRCACQVQGSLTLACATKCCHHLICVPAQFRFSNILSGKEYSRTHREGNWERSERLSIAWLFATLKTMLVVILTLPNTVTQLIKHILKNWALRTKDNMKQIWIHDYLGAGSISLPNFSQLHPPSCLLSDLTFMTEVGVTSSSDSQVSLQCWTCWGVRVHRKHHHCYRSRWRNPAWKWRKCYHFCNMTPLKRTAHWETVLSRSCQEHWVDWQ